LNKLPRGIADRLPLSIAAEMIGRGQRLVLAIADIVSAVAGGEQVIRRIPDD
jgi:hypothetical protein